MKRFLPLMTALSVTACGNSMQLLSSEATPISGACEVTVYLTRAQATANGDIEEMCIINGTTSGSFRHTIDNAIAMHKDKTCECGATNVYVESRSDTGTGLATVSMIAFEFVDE